MSNLSVTQRSISEERTTETAEGILGVLYPFSFYKIKSLRHVCCYPWIAAMSLSAADSEPSIYLKMKTCHRHAPAFTPDVAPSAQPVLPCAHADLGMTVDGLSADACWEIVLPTSQRSTLAWANEPCRSWNDQWSRCKHHMFSNTWSFVSTTLHIHSTILWYYNMKKHNVLSRSSGSGSRTSEPPSTVQVWKVVNLQEELLVSCNGLFTVAAHEETFHSPHQVQSNERLVKL